MRIATPEIIADFGEGNTFAMRPTLGVAITLLYQFNDLATLWRGVTEGHFGTLSTIIATASGSSHGIVRGAIADNMATGLRTAQAACVELLAAITDFGTDDDDPGTATDAPGITIETAFAQLFKIGCGHLGWTPAETLDASPAQILLAHRGRIDLLKSIFGGGDESEGQKPAPTKPDYSRDTDASARLRALMRYR